MTSWVLLLFLVGGQTAGVNRLVLPPSPTVIPNYPSEDACNAALDFAKTKFATDWRAVWGGCVPGP